ncbi:DUF4446 family protein [Lutibacter sp. B2]|nr:DUF4446 family protein [Lutibacter sp. B2]
MSQIFGFIKNNMSAIIFGSMILNGIMVILLCVQSTAITKLKKKYSVLSNNVEGKNIEDLIGGYYKKIEQVDMNNQQIQNQVNEIEKNVLDCVQNVGFVQYDAFDDVGGKLSFSIALLDQEHNGFLLTSMYSRSNHVVYGKPITEGQSVHSLSEEEQEALKKAKNNKNKMENF